MRGLPRIVAETPVGKQVEVVVWRGGEQQTVRSRSASCRRRSSWRRSPNSGAETPSSADVERARRHRGDLTDELRERFSWPRTQAW